MASQIRFSSNPTVQKGLILLYQDILKIKNVPLLREAYKFILNDIGWCLKSLESLNKIEWEFEDFDVENMIIRTIPAQAKYALSFNLIVMTKLATTQNSIIAMWALQPR